jgi:hypothetical protein
MTAAAKLPDPSSAAPSTLLVVILNLLFRIGVARRQEIEITPGREGHSHVHTHLEH